MSRKFKRAQQKKEKISGAAQQLFAEAVAYHQKGDLRNAEKTYKMVLNAAPDHADSIFNLGVIFQNTNQPQEAVNAYKYLIEKHPNYVNGYINLGLILESRNMFMEALAVYDKACKVKPHYISYYNLAGPLYNLRKFKDAEIALRKSIELNPNFAQSYMNLGTVLKEQKRFDEAEQGCQKALELAPEMADVHFNLAQIYEEKKEFQKAIDSFRQTLEIIPKHEKAQSCLFYRYQRACMWDEMEQLWPEIEERTKELIDADRCPGMVNFTQISVCEDKQKNLDLAKAWSKSIERKVKQDAPKFDFDNKGKDGDKITIGYLSADFRDHAFGRITKYLFEKHDRKEFRIIGYSSSYDDKSEVRKHVENSVDDFRELGDLSNIEAAKQIYEDGVDILCDCTCYTAGARVEIAAMKPAPIQINMWGFVGTTGAEFFDYIIADDIVIPARDSEFYTEKLFTMPNSLQINHKNEQISDEELKRTDFGLPEDAVVLACFNQAYKIDREMFEVWIRIVKKLPNAVLWLKKSEARANENLLQRWKDSGLEEERLIFADKIDDRAKYYSRIQLADLCIDTRIYNGGSTTMDSLWAGVPVITVLGEHYASRMSAGLINGANMSECITNNIEEYEELVVRLVENSEELKNMKEKLWKEREICPLFDTGKFVDDLEKGYQMIWNNYLEDNEPKHIKVQP